jgi:hypothetical protein
MTLFRLRTIKVVKKFSHNKAVFNDYKTVSQKSLKESYDKILQ